MNQTKAEMMVARLMANAALVQYGTVSVSVKLHCGRIVEVAYSTTENTREPLSEKQESKGQVI